MSGDQLCCLIACTVALTATTAAASPATAASQFALFLMTTPFLSSVLVMTRMLDRRRDVKPTCQNALLPGSGLTLLAVTTK